MASRTRAVWIGSLRIPGCSVKISETYRFSRRFGLWGLSPQSPSSQSTNQNVGVPQFWALYNTDEKNVLYDRYWLLLFVNRGGLSIPASPPVPQGAALSMSQVLYSAFCSISFSPQGPFLYHKHYFAPPRCPLACLPGTRLTRRPIRLAKPGG